MLRFDGVCLRGFGAGVRLAPLVVEYVDGGHHVADAERPFVREDTRPHSQAVKRAHEEADGGDGVVAGALADPLVHRQERLGVPGRHGVADAAVELGPGGVVAVRAVLRQPVGEVGAGDDDGAAADAIDGAADGIPQLEVLAGGEERYVHGGEGSGGHAAAQVVERNGDGPVEPAVPTVGRVQWQLGAAGFLAHRLDEVAVGLEAEADLGRAPAGEVALRFGGGKEDEGARVERPVGGHQEHGLRTVHGDVGGHLLQGFDSALHLSLAPASHLLDDDRRVRGNAGEFDRRHGDTLGILYPAARRTWGESLAGGYAL